MPDGEVKNEHDLLYNFMLKKQYRLGGKQKLIFVDTLKTPFFLIKIAKNQLPYSRFRFVVSKKVDKRAVVRNRMRRVASTCVQQVEKRIVPGHDFVFSLTKGALVGAKHEVCASIIEQLRTKNYLT